MISEELQVREMPAGEARPIPEHTLEILSDSGEGAQLAGTVFALTTARMGNGVWTVQLIPAEIQPPARTAGGLSGARIRFGTRKVTNPGDRTNVVVAFNEVVLEARMDADALADGAAIFIDNQWADHYDEEVQASYKRVLERARRQGYEVFEIPLETETAKVVDNPRRGKNMWAVGLLAYLYQRDFDLLKAMVARQFKSKGTTVVENNLALIERGYEYARQTLPYCYHMPAVPPEAPQVVMDGNQALAMGAIAAGFKLCSMYPITPASSQSHYLAPAFSQFSGIVHQAEDEIAAIAVALGAAYGGQPAYTITSGPGMALKTEIQALAVMTETPLVIVNVQRGGPSTGLPTKVEQSDLLSSVFGTPGDAPKVVIAASTIEECYHVMKTARQIAEQLRTLVIVLSDANLATGVQPFDKPVEPDEPPADALDLRPVTPGFKPFDWDTSTGIAPRAIPGQPGGTHTVTGLNHDSNSHVSYDPEVNQWSHEMRSRKLQVLQQSLRPPEVFGEDSGQLLLVGWGSTRGAIEEAVNRAQAEGYSVSSLHLRFLSPLAPGIKELLKQFDQQVCVEINYSDPQNGVGPRRYSQLATLLRAETLVDVDSWSNVYGQPLKPVEIYQMIQARLVE
ncbi:MAG: 2-oxoacid:acceptor oxidoreductase subunit alpha [Anaerolineae bacterium]